MQSSARIALLALGTLVVGFGLGRWTMSPPPFPPAADNSALAESPQPTSAIPAAVALPALTLTPVAPFTHTPVAQRLEALLWLQKNKLIPGLRFLENNGLLTLEFQQLFDLSDFEIAALNEEIRHVKSEVDALNTQASTSHLSEDAATLVIDVPPISPTQSDPLHDRLLAAFSNTLGPQKFGAFIQLSGEFIEASFNRFGLNARRIAISLEPELNSSGQPVFDYQHYDLDATGHARLSASATTTADDLLRTHPAVQRHLENLFLRPSTTEN